MRNQNCDMERYVVTEQLPDGKTKARDYIRENKYAFDDAIEYHHGLGMYPLYATSNAGVRYYRWVKR